MNDRFVNFAGLLAGRIFSQSSGAVALALAALLSGNPAEAQRNAGAADHSGDFPFLTACITTHMFANNVVNKGIAIKLGNGAYVCFDPDLLRMGAGWTGSYLRLNGVMFTGSQGGDHPSIAGDQKFGTRALSGVAGADGAFKDPRSEPYGPIPASLGRWSGLYVIGTNVVLAYTAMGNKILELPASTAADGLTGFVRNFKVEKTAAAYSLMLCEVEGGTGSVAGTTATLKDANGAVTMVALAGAPAGVALALAENNRVFLKVPANAPAGTFKVVLWNGGADDQAKFAGLLAGNAAVPDVDKGGPAHWKEPTVTRGTVRNTDAAYAVDKLTPPVNNAWNHQVRISGFDFFADGTRAACCTWDGDIWIVSGIDDKLDHLSWKLFASGLYEPLGLKIVNDVIYTSARDQVTRYHDLNGDGEADFYENFNNEITSSTGFHEFVFDLQTNSQGDFFLAKAGPVKGGGRGFGPPYGNISEFAGTVMKLAKDGSKLEVYATGFRAPNGITVGPHDEITTSDNEGTWVPSTPIYWITNGGYYGVPDTAHLAQIPEYKQPVCWLSHADFDNSGGEQVWVTSKKWGPFEGELLHTSYGMCSLFLVLRETVNGVMQGGVVKLPARFSSSAMRARFNPVDGQLYVAGLQGWQTTAVNITGFDRVRYTGKPFFSVDALHVIKTGVTLHFTQPLDPASAGDIQNYSVKRWNYAHTSEYGSPELSVANPAAHIRDTLPVQAAKVSADGLTVTLDIADLKTVMQQSIHFVIKAKDGTEIDQTIQHTINVIP